MIDWAELHRLNRTWRAWMDNHSAFVTPETIDSLRYAAGEAREARMELSAIAAELLIRYLVEVAPVNTVEILRIMDSHAHESRDLWMRERLPSHARNHPRANKIRQELAQVVMLALTALDGVDMGKIVPAHEIDLDYICDTANQAITDYGAFLTGWCWTVHHLLAAVAAYPGVDVAADLRECWSRLAWKHASRDMGLYPKELI
ncbi:MAG: hypothetical protein E6Q97_15875 [Desulfurellales bacterium]|nr:MAG: hypothetical protein E6Q97_15875 [Desulfurellales bacterium]